MRDNIGRRCHKKERDISIRCRLLQLFCVFWELFTALLGENLGSVVFFSWLSCLGLPLSCFFGQCLNTDISSLTCKHL
jgi:hypothetical protein